MKSDRLLPHLLLFGIAYFSFTTMAMAGWGFGGTTTGGRSGLDLDGGYDLNTVVTVSGTVIDIPVETGPKQFVINLADGSDPIHLVVGPTNYWAEHGIAVLPGEELSATGAKAQGADGVTYLLVDRLVNLTTSQELRLRSADGRPVWSGGQRGLSSPRTSPPRTFSPRGFQGGRRGGR